jgi:hypothetical protein
MWQETTDGLLSQCQYLYGCNSDKTRICVTQKLQCLSEQDSLDSDTRPAQCNNFAALAPTMYVNSFKKPIPVTVQSKAWVCGCSLLGIMGSNPAGSRKSISCECSVLLRRGPCVGLITRTEESYRLCCVWVWSWSLHSEEALAYWGLLRHGKTNILQRACSFLHFARYRTRRVTFKFSECPLYICVQLHSQ